MKSDNGWRWRDNGWRGHDMYKKKMEVLAHSLRLQSTMKICTVLNLNWIYIFSLSNIFNFFFYKSHDQKDRKSSILVMNCVIQGKFNFNSSYSSNHLQCSSDQVLWLILLSIAISLIIFKFVARLWFQNCICVREREGWSVRFLR